MDLRDPRHATRAVREYLAALDEQGEPNTPPAAVSPKDPAARWTAAPGGPAFHAYSNVDAVFDTIGGDTQQRSFRVLKRGGVLVSVAAPPSSEEATKFGVYAEFAITQPSAAQLAKIAELVDSGQLKPIVDTVLPLSEVRRAHEMSERGHVWGKILLTVD